MWTGAERLARARAKKLFGSRYANVQPHSGTQANMVAYLALLEPGDTFLGMALDHGGHLSHGHPLNFSGQSYHPVAYGVHPETERLDLDQLHRLAREHRPKMIMVGASAYPRLFPCAEIREIADEVGARVVHDIAHIAGLVAGKRGPGSPAPVGHRHQHHPQDPPGAARWTGPLEPEGACEEAEPDHLPRGAGRTDDAHDRRQGGLFSARRSTRRSAPMPAR